MKRVVLVSAAVLVVGSVFGQGAATGDRSRLEGDWDVVSITVGGIADPPTNDKAMKLRFQNNKVIALETDSPKEEFTYKLDETKKPKQIEVDPVVKGGKPGFKGIYQLAGDQLKIGINVKNMGAAPESFDAKDVAILTLKRLPKQK